METHNFVPGQDPKHCAKCGRLKPHPRHGTLMGTISGDTRRDPNQAQTPKAPDYYESDPYDQQENE